MRDLRSFEEVGVDKFKGVVFFVTRRERELGGHGGFEALCFLGWGFNIEKLREWLEERGIERPAVILGGGVF